MAEPKRLNKNLQWTPLGTSGRRILAPNLQGNVIWRPPAEHAPLMFTSQSGGQLAGADPIERARLEAGLEDLGSAELPSRSATLSDTGDQIEVDYEADDSRFEFAILRDEAGTITLHEPIDSAPVQPTAAVAARAGGGVAKVPRRRKYVIKLRHANYPVGGVPRTAMLGGIGGKVLRFFGGVIDHIMGSAVFEAASLWERKYRAPEGLFAANSATELCSAVPKSPFDSSSFDGKKSLLFIHGTISSTKGAFSGLQQFPSKATALFKDYENRVLAFNHHTLTKSVGQNALDFLNSLSPGSYDFDVICHSRGGLITRALKQLQPSEIAALPNVSGTVPANVTVKIGKVGLVGVPNMGTPLANPSDLKTAVSWLASVASSFHQDVVDFGLGALFAIFGALVKGGVGALPGLEDMNPGSAFLEALNLGDLSANDFYAVEADFRASGGLLQVMAEDGIGALFEGEANDLVVPTDGVSQLGSQTVPRAQIDLYPQGSNVYHTDYFEQGATWDVLNAFLP
ncbi:MAG TPA: hypothetical protein VFO34_15430 [Candidatus Acidoferrales bacterium]|nr:hypothetical protein [Candidatus Acidoferrales bacterium]